MPRSIAPQGLDALFVPDYRPLAVGKWRLDVAPLGVMPGYWSAPAIAENTAILTENDATWMSITPLELESQGIGVQLARGHVLIHGLGMGWAVAATAFREAVSAVTVVERDPQVRDLIAAIDPFAQLPEMARRKIAVIAGDAMDYNPARPVDFLMPDIWRPLINDTRIAEVRAMQARAQATAIHFWGQELELARHARAAGRALDHAGLAATIAAIGLPLVGLELPDYPAMVAAAAKRHMGTAWFRDRAEAETALG